MGARKSQELAWLFANVCWLTMTVTGCKHSATASQSPSATSRISGSAGVATLAQSTVGSTPWVRPTNVPRHLAFGDQFGCAVVEPGISDRVPGTVLCWGETSAWLSPQMVPRQFFGVKQPHEIMGPAVLPGLTDLVEIQGSRSMCGRRANGEVWCWGPQPGPFRDGPGAHYEMSGPKRVAGVGYVLQLAVGMTTACVITTEGNVKCWGDNSKGALGDGTTDQPQRHVDVELGFKAVGITLDGFESCAWSSEGKISCWGRVQTSAGKTSIKKPQDVATIPNLAHLDLTHNCALLRDRTVQCWKGSLLANAVEGKPFLIAALPAISDAVAVVGTHEYTCILRGNGHLNCRASSERAAVPGEPRAPAQLNFHDLEEPAGIVEVAADAGRMCARLGTGKIVCWGSGSHGELGDGQATVREQAAPILWPHDAAGAPQAEYSRVCRMDSDCQWDRSEHPTRCQASHGESQAPASGAAGICSCLDNRCTWQHLSTKAPGNAECFDFSDCRYDTETRRCRSAVVGERPLSSMYVGPVPICQCQQSHCDLIQIQPVPCKSDQDCWFSDTQPHYPIARPKNLRGHKFQPCVDGEVPPICHEICGFGFPYGC